MIELNKLGNYPTILDIKVGYKVLDGLSDEQKEEGLLPIVYLAYDIDVMSQEELDDYITGKNLDFTVDAYIELYKNSSKNFESIDDIIPDKAYTRMRHAITVQGETK